MVLELNIFIPLACECLGFLQLITLSPLAQPSKIPGFLQDCSDSRGHYSAEHLQAWVCRRVTSPFVAVVGLLQLKNPQQCIALSPRACWGPPAKG